MSSRISDFDNYSNFLEGFLQKGYKFVPFSDSISSEGEVVLRHDIDFDTGFALEAAVVEKALGIKSTFFFLLRSPFYNVLTPEVAEDINKIREMGHEISIHFDPTLYKDIEGGLSLEKQYWRTIFDQEIKIISLHRPDKLFLNRDETVDGVEHTYMSKYFKGIKYIADSTGQWRYGHPFDSEEFKKSQSIQLLIHPIWWFTKGETNLDKLRAFWYLNVDRTKDIFCANSIPFREIASKLGVREVKLTEEL